MKITSLALFILILLVVNSGTLAAQEDTVTLHLTEDSAYSVILPDGWVMQGNREEGLFLANSENVFATIDGFGDLPALKVGEVYMAISVIEAEDETSYAEILDTFAEEDIHWSDGAGSLLPIETIEFSGRDAAYTEFSDSVFEGSLLAFAIAPDTVGLAMVVTGIGELAEQSIIAYDTLATVRYALPLTEDKDAPLAYPAEWTFDADAMLVANSENTSDVLASGEFTIHIAELREYSVRGADLEEQATQLGMSLAFGAVGLTFTDAVYITVDEIPVAVISIANNKGDYIGGVFLVEGATTTWVAYYLSAPNESYQIDLMALNILLAVAQE